MSLLSNSVHRPCHAIEEEHFGSSFAAVMAICKSNQFLGLGYRERGEKVRENRVKRAVIMADGNAITAADLDLADDAETHVQTLRESRMASDKRTVSAALAAASGSISHAAKILGISRPTLYDLVKELDLKVP